LNHNKKETLFKNVSKVIMDICWVKTNF